MGKTGRKKQKKKKRRTLPFGRTTTLPSTSIIAIRSTDHLPSIRYTRTRTSSSTVALQIHQRKNLALSKIMSFYHIPSHTLSGLFKKDIPPEVGSYLVRGTRTHLENAYINVDPALINTKEMTVLWNLEQKIMALSTTRERRNLIKENWSVIHGVYPKKEEGERRAIGGNPGRLDPKSYIQEDVELAVYTDGGDHSFLESSISPFVVVSTCSSCHNSKCRRKLEDCIKLEDVMNDI
jgi:hypothetical protein